MKKKLKLLWFDLVGGSVRHKITTCELAVMTFLSKAMSKVSGVIYTDATLSMAKHIDLISRSAYLEIRRISSVRHLLRRKATVQLMCSFALSRLDYCNSLLIDITSNQNILP